MSIDLPNLPDSIPGPDTPIHSDDILISEVFGPTIQGEGPSLGRRAAFVRLGACNLSCGYCDTKYTWDWAHYDAHKELRWLHWSSIVNQVREMRVPLTVITGGEPLLQQVRLADLLVPALSHSMQVEIETNGTILPNSKLQAQVSRFNVSPKLSNSNNSIIARQHLEVLRQMSQWPNVIFKFVVTCIEDLDEVAGLCHLASIHHDQVYIMPEGVSVTQQVNALSALADAVIAHHFNLTMRLHILAWGNQRGK